MGQKHRDSKPQEYGKLRKRHAGQIRWRARPLKIHPGSGLPQSWAGENYARNIRAAKSEDEYEKFADLFLKPFEAIKEALEEIFTGSTDERWDDALAGSLETCVAGLRRTHHRGGGCRVSVAEETVGKFASISGSPKKIYARQVLQFPILG